MAELPDDVLVDALEATYKRIGSLQKIVDLYSMEVSRRTLSRVLNCEHISLRERIEVCRALGLPMPVVPVTVCPRCGRPPERHDCPAVPKRIRTCKAIGGLDPELHFLLQQHRLAEGNTWNEYLRWLYDLAGPSRDERNKT